MRQSVHVGDIWKSLLNILKSDHLVSSLEQISQLCILISLLGHSNNTKLHARTKEETKWPKMGRGYQMKDYVIR